jgi:PAS domain S-box-containing protein
MAKTISKPHGLIRTVIVLVSFAALLILVPSLYIESTLRDQLYQEKINDLSQDMQDWCNRLDENLAWIENSTLKLSSLVDQALSNEPVFRSDEFDHLVLKGEDGAWRSRKELFSASQEAGLCIPRTGQLDDRLKGIYLQLKEITTLYGTALNHPLLPNTWVIPISKGIVIYWPQSPHFIYQMEADFDYNDTKWVTYADPRNNPEQKPRWIINEWDPVPQKYLCSVVKPYHLNGQWAGAVGHDIRVETLVDYTGSLIKLPGSHISLLDQEGNVLVTDLLVATHQDSPQPEKQREPVQSSEDAVQLTLATDNEIHKKAFEIARTLPFSQIQHERLGSNHLLIGRTQGPGWIMVHSFPQTVITTILRTSFTNLRLLILCSWGLAILAICAVIIRDRFQFLREEKKNRESRERFELALWSAGLGLWDLNLPKGEHVVNSRYAEILGYRMEEVEADPDFWESHLHPEDRQRVLEEVRANLEGKTEIYQCEYRMKTREGKWRWILDTGKVVERDRNGLPLRATGVHQDITARKEFEEFILKSNEYELLLVERMAVVHGISLDLAKCWSVDDLCRKAVELAHEKLGFERLGIWFISADETRQQGSFGVDETGEIRDERGIEVGIDPDLCRLQSEQIPYFQEDHHPLVNHLGNVVGYGPYVVAALWDGHRIMGSISVDTFLSGKPIPQLDCEILCMFARVVAHLYTLKQTEELLYESRQNLAHAQKIAQVGNWVYDYRTGKLSWSDELYEIFGISPPQSIETSLTPLPTQTDSQEVFHAFYQQIHPEDLPQIRVIFEAARIERKPFDCEFRFYGKNQEVRHAQAIAEITGDGASYHQKMLGIIQDITDRIRAEEERKSIEEQLQHTQKLESLGVLAGGIAHDFNNLLMAILGNADLALMTLPPSAAIRENLVQIEKASRSAADLTRQMLAYAGKGKFLVENISLSNLITEMKGFLEASVSKASSLYFNLGENLPAIQADMAQVRQVVMNLVLNASEALQGNDGMIVVTTGLLDYQGEDEFESTAQEKSVRFAEGDLSKGPYVYLEVSDTGCGMDEEVRRKIFDPFFTTKFTGRGLGLAAVLGIVRGHRGMIHLKTEVNRGTTFRVLFPALSYQLPIVGEKVEAPTHLSQGMHLLLVDDEEIVRLTGLRLLEHRGWKVSVAENGLEAIELVKTEGNQFDVVLLDLTMPKMDGIQTFHELKAINPELPIIISSGYTEEDSLTRFPETPPEGFIQKPYVSEALHRELVRVLHPRQS